MSIESPTPQHAASTGSDPLANRSHGDILHELTETVARLVSTASHRAHAAEEAERAHRVALSAETDRHREALESIERRCTDDRDAAMRTRDTTLASAEQTLRQRLERIESSVGDERRTLEQRGRAAIHKLRTKLDESVWVAETVYEANEDKPRIAYEELRERVTTRLQELGDLEDQAKRQVRRYRQRVPSEDFLTDEVRAAVADDPDAALAAAIGNAPAELHRLRRLPVPGLFRGVIPILPLVFMMAGGAAISAMPDRFNDTTALLRGLAIGAGAFVVVAAIAWVVAMLQVRRAWASFGDCIARARAAGDRLLALGREQRAAQEQALIDTRDRDIETARTTLPPKIDAMETSLAERLATIAEKGPRRETRARAERDRVVEEAERASIDAKRLVEETHERELAEEHERHERTMREIETDRGSASDRAAAAWRTEGERSMRTLASLAVERDRLHPAWEPEHWNAWEPEQSLPTFIPVGTLTVDRTAIEGAAPEEEELRLDAPMRVDVPALLAIPERGSLLIETDSAGRDAGLALLRSTMLRLLVSLPPGKVRFTIFDPVGLGEPFAGFMHLADEMESLVTDRIWTDPRHIDQRLTDLTEHMETVIQKYLRNEFDSIVSYNERAGEIAEPFRFLVIADLPAAFNDDASKRLHSIVNSGPRCGVHVLTLFDPRRQRPEALDVDLLRERSIRVVHDGRADGPSPWRFDEGALADLPFVPAAAPPEPLLADLVRRAGRAAKTASRVEVPFAVIAPKPEEYWTRDTRKLVSVPLGRAGATKLQELSLGVGTSQHALVAGKTGSGKSTLLHALVTNLACWYSPDEVEFWLVDFKKGVEFKTYANHRLPHARTVAVESDREFGLSVLQGLDDELRRRGELYREVNAQDLAGFRERCPDQPMPRILLIIDEFQELFVDEDRIAQEASLLLDRLVRQGRAFGMHVVLGSQTLAGAYSLARSTMGQMGVRIALQCSEIDSQLILSDDNTAARLLSRPGEAIYNDHGGLLEGNHPFQVCWLDETDRDAHLSEVERRAAAAGYVANTVVFEGNAPAKLEDQRVLADAKSDVPAAVTTAPIAWLGEAIAIRDPTAATFRHQPAANLLVVGQQDLEASGIVAGALLGLAAQHRARAARFVVLDGLPADHPHHGDLGAIADALPHASSTPGFREVEDAIRDVGAEVARRLEEEDPTAPNIFVLIHGLQRFRVLRRDENDFGFSSSYDDEADAAPKADKVLATILREGPGVGVHVIAWCDTVANLNRTLDRASINEFDQRALFQIGSTDSSSLIDSPDAARLGPHRALLYREELGTLEKFRPWRVPDETWWRAFAADLAARG